ncbi:MAG: hypothetical protein ACK48V_02905 [Crocinitomicaceae bacterium]|jgi:hypothetical protein
MFKIRSIIREMFIHLKNIKIKQDEINNRLIELEWSQIYHDSIRGKKWIEELPLNIGRWAGNYTFFYVLYRILSEVKPKSILELGLGESTKYISTFIENELLETKHLVVEHDLDWANNFTKKFSLSKNTEVLHLNLNESTISGLSKFNYQNFDNIISDEFDFFLIDGPFGSERESRDDIIELVKNFNHDRSFVIMFDDSNRKGEHETIINLINILEEKQIKYFTFTYSGNKSVTVIASKEYKYLSSL